MNVRVNLYYLQLLLLYTIISTLYKVRNYVSKNEGRLDKFYSVEQMAVLTRSLEKLQRFVKEDKRNREKRRSKRRISQNLVFFG